MKKLSLAVASFVVATSAWALPYGSVGSSVTTEVWYVQSNDPVASGPDYCGNNSCTAHNRVLREYNKIPVYNMPHGSQPSDHADAVYHIKEVYESDKKVSTPSDRLIPTTGISNDEGHSFSEGVGYANAAKLKMGAAARSHSNNFDSELADTFPANQGQVTAEFTNKLRVEAGTSGLSDGDVVQLVLSLRLDGFMDVTTDSSNGDSWAHSKMWAELEVIDTTAGLDNRHMWEELATFYGDMSVETYAVVNNANLNYGAIHSYAYTATSNTGDEHMDGKREYDDRNDDVVYHAKYNFDTGVLELTFDVIVGNEISFFGYLETWASTNGTANAKADFSNTFSNSVVSTVDGVVLKWELADGNSSAPVSVPEPGSFLLMLAGLAGILRRACKSA